MMRRFLDRRGAGKLGLLLSLAAGLLLVLGVGQASAATLSVCSSGCPYTQIGPALAAAHDGDMIKIGPGTYAGGVTVNVSVKLLGAGAGRTVIRGGGPVLTIGEFGASSEPTVTIDGVTITGGVIHEGVAPGGGGVAIPPSADFGLGATVTITNAVITGNRVAPSETVPSGEPCPGGDDCPFAFAGGGGIENSGTLTLERTTVSDNRVGSASGLSDLTSDAIGGGIVSFQGAVKISGSVLRGNQTGATGPNGRFAEGGAAELFGGTLTLTNSSVTDNSSILSSSLPADIEQVANGGGIHIGGGVTRAAISNSTFARNSVTATNAIGDAIAFSGGLHVDAGVDFKMSNTVLSGNTVSCATLASSSGNADCDSAGAQLVGNITNSVVSGNSVTASSAHGDATAGGNFILGASMTNSTIRDNHGLATSAQGSAFALGGGLWVDSAPDVGVGGLTLRNSSVSGNTAEAHGVTGAARGGGVYDPAPANPPFGGPLVLQNSSVTGNVLTASAGLSREGGGLYIRGQSLTLRHSSITGNTPDQCSGC
jgi:hypothetical protein